VGFVVLAIGILFFYSLYNYITTDILFNDDFNVFYTGIINGQFKGRGQFIGCGQVNDSPLHLIIQLSEYNGKGYIIISLPLDVSLGTHLLSNSGNVGEVYLISGNIYQHKDKGSLILESLSFDTSDIDSGSITFDAFPKAAYQPLRGSFQAKVRTGTGRNSTVDIHGSFDFSSRGVTPLDCPD
jgi:hypothetical protein